MTPTELQLTVAYERDEDGWWVAHLLEIPDAIGQGRSKPEARAAALESLSLVLKIRRDGYLREQPTHSCEILKLAA